VTANSQGSSNLLPSSNPPTSFSASGAQALTRAPTQPTSWNFLDTNTLGGNARWVTPTSDKIVRPLRWLVTYTITFTTDCPQNDVILNIASTGSLFIELNGKIIKSWLSPYPVTHQIKLSQPDLICGCNSVKVMVYNYYYASPVGMIYSLTQDKSGCYECQNSGDAFYNRNTCQCECSFEANCKDSHLLKVWRDYPTCGCRCSVLAYCTNEFYWNSKTCGCECKKKCCPKDHVLDPSTCKCVKKCLIDASSCTGNTWFDDINCKCVYKCLPFAPCPTGKEWNFKTCNCECSTTKSCNSIQRWNPNTCNCDCLALPLCIAGYVFDPDTCLCKPGSGSVGSLSSTVTINGGNWLDQLFYLLKMVWPVSFFGCFIITVNYYCSGQ